MCPSDGCEATGCVGQRYTDKQPLACGVDTVNGDIGATFSLTFSVRNSAGLQAIVQRLIMIISPCASGQFYCGGSCTNVDCSTFTAAAAVIPELKLDLTVPPTLILLPTSKSNWTATTSNNATIYLEYGALAPFSIAPCSSAASANQSAPASCAAAALDVIDGDLTHLIKVTDVSAIPNQIR